MDKNFAASLMKSIAVPTAVLGPSDVGRPVSCDLSADSKRCRPKSERGSRDCDRVGCSPKRQIDTTMGSIEAYLKMVSRRLRGVIRFGFVLVSYGFELSEGLKENERALSGDVGAGFVNTTWICRQVD